MLGLSQSRVTKICCGGFSQATVHEYADEVELIARDPSDMLGGSPGINQDCLVDLQRS